MKKVAYFTNIAPHYRETLWLNFAKCLGVEFHFYFGHHPNQSIRSIDFTTQQWKEFKNQIHTVHNLEVNNTLVYQRKLLREILFKDWDVIILIGQARIISIWLSAIVAKLRGIPVLFWGHGLYGSETFLKKLFLKSFLSLGDEVLVYGNYAKNLLIKENFKPEHIRVIYNSINYDSSKRLRKSAIIPGFYNVYFKNNLPTLIFIGRLTQVKRLQLLLQAVHQLNANQKQFNLMLIGDGEARKELENLANELSVDAYFYGACYEEQKISRFLANADLCVSPGNVGLTSIHAMSYGTPVCTHNDFKNQMPEFEAITSRETGCFFDNEKINLSETIVEWFKNRPDRNEIRKKCYAMIDNYYNPEVQIKVLRKAIDDLVQ